MTSTPPPKVVATSTIPLANRSKSELRKVVYAAGIGNFLEYFEWGLYGFFATIIGAQFFPGEDPATQLLSVFGVFAVGFVFRPIGGLVLGPLGDKVGRRAAMATSLIIMGVATTAIGLLPPQAVIGVWAPILLVTFRCLQGFSTGGEFTSSMSLLMETVPVKRRGRYGSLQPIASASALIAASLSALVLTSALSEEALSSWGWRIPFVFAAVLTAFGIWLRLRLEDSPVFQALESHDKVTKQSVWRMIGKNIKPILVVTAVMGVQAVGYYYLGTYAVNFLTTTLEIERTASLVISLIILVSYAIMCYFSGLLLDRFGRRPIQLVGVVGFIIVSIPAFMLMSTGNFVLIGLGLFLIAVCQSFAVVSMTLIIVEMFPSSSRATGAAAGVNLGAVLLAGPTPYVASWIVLSTGNPVTGAAWLIAVAVVGLLIMIKGLPETRGRDMLSNKNAFEEAREARELESVRR